MADRTGLVTLQGNPITLTGTEVKKGDVAPDAELVTTDLAPIKLSDYAGRVRIVASVPSLDTPVCDLETRQFNDRASQLGNDVIILTVSMDLPFAQKRWCGAAGVDRVITLSDHRAAEFGLAYGLLIKELRLLARAVLVIDRDDRITYLELVPEVGQEPDYEAALAAAKQAAA